MGFIALWGLDWGRIHFQAHFSCWQNSFPCVCRTHGSLFLQSQQERDTTQLGALCIYHGIITQWYPITLAISSKNSWEGYPVTFAILGWLEASLKSCPHSWRGDYTKAWAPGSWRIGGHSRACALWFPVSLPHAKCTHPCPNSQSVRLLLCHLTVKSGLGMEEVLQYDLLSITTGAQFLSSCGFGKLKRQVYSSAFPTYDGWWWAGIG